ncbi:MAG: hypothetical protein LUD12_13235 [Lachnospiraceae bacterium]|nr:hypothetical protein [Lachnospiraceae bacterium]
MESTRYEVHYIFSRTKSEIKDVILCWCPSIDEAKNRIEKNKKKVPNAKAYLIYDTEEVLPVKERDQWSKYKCVHKEYL